MESKRIVEETEMKITRQSYDYVAAQYAEDHDDVTKYGPTFKANLNSFVGRTWKLKKGGKVLDLGCGSGRDVEFFSDPSIGLSVVGLDFSENLIREAKKREELKRKIDTNFPKKDYVVADVRYLPLREDVFHGIWSSATLHHLPESYRIIAFEEISRILKNDGILYFSVRKGHGSDTINYKDSDQNEHPRYFYFFDEMDITTLFDRKEIKLKIKEIFDNPYHRKRQGSEKWLNVFARK